MKRSTSRKVSREMCVANDDSAAIVEDKTVCVIGSLNTSQKIPSFLLATGKGLKNIRFVRQNSFIHFQYNPFGVINCCFAIDIFFQLFNAI